MTIRRLLAASAAFVALAGAAHAGDITYPQLQTQTTVQDTDLLAIWRSSGPLAKLNASIFSQYVVNGLGKSTFLQTSNALSELSSVQASARSNLGLGSAATAATGTSGNVLCFLNSNCTRTGTETFNAAVTLSGGVSGATAFSGQPTFSSASGPIISSGIAASNATYLFLRPTDFAAGKPELFFQANGGAGAWLFGTYDGTTFGTGSLSVNVATTFSNGLTVVGALTLPSQSVTSGMIANGAVGSTQLASSGATAGTYGDSGHVAQLTVDNKGRVTSASSVSIASPIPSMTGQSGALLSNNGTTTSWTSRANAYFSGCTALGCSLYSGNGISSATRNSVGNYFVNFTTAFADGNYTVICTTGANGATSATCIDNSCPNNSCSHIATGVAVAFFGPSGTAVDPSGGFNILIIHN